MSSRAKNKSDSAKQVGSPRVGGEDTKAKWSAHTYSLESLVEQFALPQVARCNIQALFTKHRSPLPVNLGQPMLLFDTRTIRKLLARNVLWNRASRRYAETEETIVIPEDYEGNFVRLRSRTAKDHSVHSSIESIANYKIPAFLNLTLMAAFKVASDKNSNEYPLLEFAPGNIFIVERVIKGTARVKLESRIFKTTEHASTDVYYLKCHDERQNSLLLPLSQRGEFVEILSNPYGNGKLSSKSEEIIATQKYPLVVRYVYGGSKPRLTSFSGLFTLLDSFQETTVMACSLHGSQFTLLELPLSSPLQFELAVNVRDLVHLPIMKSAIQLCKAKGGIFTKDIKFKYKFAQKYSETFRDRSYCEENGDLDPPSARSSARLGITQTYIYL